MRHSRPHPETGSAVLEAFLLGVLLLVPLVYLVVTLSAMQGAAFAAEGAARQAARVIALADTDAAGRRAADAAVRTALADWHIAPGAAAATVTCTPDPNDCRTPRGTVAVRVEIAVALPAMPPALHLDAPGTVRVDARAVQLVSRFAAVAP